jgi:eukaryotic-like serine/threonine-protein kinase
MGKVYLAQHPGIGRRTAIKVLHPNLAGDPAAVSRFFAEARASNAIRHPNIVEIFDSGTLDTGAPYIIMEHLEGETLAARMVAGLALGPALDFACQAASALAAAHAQQIVHRDLKPENLFVVSDPRVPGRELVKVLDFGVAKLAQRLEEPAYRTRSGSLVGTPRYMSPEQCLGEAEIDARSDIYSLGVIVYEMACGRPPFVTEAVGAVINMHINRPPDAPRAVNPAISAPLEAAILRALAKKPADRFPDMAAFLMELRVTAAGLGEARESVPPREDSVLANVSTPTTPTPLSAMATLMDARPPSDRYGEAQRDANPPRDGARRAKPGGSPLGTLPTTPPPSVSGSAQPGATVARGRRWVFWVIGLVELAAAVVLFLTIRPDRREPQPAAPSAAQAPRAPAAPAAPVQRALVALDSVPPGATVSANGRPLGVTPLQWTAERPGELTELAFELEGHRREVILAVPAAGLRLRPQLRRLAPRRGAAVDAHPVGEPAVPDDIKSER